MSYNTIEIKKMKDILILYMNNPKKLNILSCESIRELADAITVIEKNDDIRVVIVTGVGKAFVAGADISYMQNFSPFDAISFCRNTTRVYEEIEKSGKIYIGAINGYALGGGCEFALALDIRIASENAKFALPEASLGVLPGGGGTQRLPRLIGRSKALELMITCDCIDAEKAFGLGLVNSIVPHEMLMSEAMKIAHKILKNSRRSVSLIKECVGKSDECTMMEGIEFEKNMFGLCFSTEDQKEKMASFLEKRK